MKELTHPRIAFTGLAGCGKTTACDIMKQYFGAVVMSWATPVKLEIFDFLQRYRLEYGTAEKELFGKEDKQVLASMPPIEILPLPARHGVEPAERVAWINANKQWLRPMLQWWGTDYRRAQDVNYWVNQGKRVLDEARDISVIVCDDARYPNEIEALKERGFCIVRVERPGLDKMDHPTETTELPHDYVILNDKPITVFRAEVLNYAEKG